MATEEHSTSRLPDRLYSAAEAARVLDVPANVIHQWAYRKLISRSDRIPGPGRRGLVPLYRLTELQPLADAYHRRTSTNTNTEATARRGST